MARWSSLQVSYNDETVVTVEVGEVSLEVRRVFRDGLWWVEPRQATEVVRACDHLSSDEIGELLWDIEHAN